MAPPGKIFFKLVQNWRFPLQNRAAIPRARPRRPHSRSEMLLGLEQEQKIRIRGGRTSYGPTWPGPTWPFLVRLRCLARARSWSAARAWRGRVVFGGGPFPSPGTGRALPMWPPGEGLVLSCSRGGATRLGGVAPEARVRGTCPTPLSREVVRATCTRVDGEALRASVHGPQLPLASVRGVWCAEPPIWLRVP